MKSELIQPTHLARKAIVYVRQSSPHQALANQESLASNTTFSTAPGPSAGPGRHRGHRRRPRAERRRRGAAGGFQELDRPVSA